MNGSPAAPAPKQQQAASLGAEPIPDADIDGLLYGLDADDFDDFDGLEAAPAAAAPADRTPPPVRLPEARRQAAPPDPRRTPSPEPDDARHDAFFTPLPAEIPAVVSFATAAGRKLARPSEAAMNKALKLMREAEEEPDPALEDPSPAKRRRVEPDTPLAAKSRPALEVASSRPGGPLAGPSRAAFQLKPAHATPTPPSNGEVRPQSGTHVQPDVPMPSPVPVSRTTAGNFSLASGDPAPSLSSEGVVRAQAMSASIATPTSSAPISDQLPACEPLSPSPFNPPPRERPSSAHFGSGFQLGTGLPAPPPKPESIKRALAIFEDQPSMSNHTPAESVPSPAKSAPRSPSESPPSPSKAPPGPSKSGFQLGSGEALPPPTAESRSQALALFGGDFAAAPSTPRPSLPPRVSFTPPASSIPATPPVFSASRPGRPSLTTPLGLTTPSRPPLRTTTNTPGPHALGGTPSQLKSLKPIQIRTPGPTPRRIGLGASPARGGKVRNSGFVTPFKKPGAASQPATSPAVAMRGSNLRGLLARASTSATPATPVTPAKKFYESVFNLEPPPDRKGMRESLIQPQRYANVELHRMGLPDEIWRLELSNAKFYHFAGEDGTKRGNKQAFEQLKLDKCNLATQKWTNNHWSLILWKLAGQIRGKPALFEQKWNWDEVIAQLKYRYERETGSAQRPIIRRIQEHDSPPTLPMVLCVSGIHDPPPVEDSDGNMTQPRPYLVLTDGWYHIRATIDDCLVRAVNSSKITIGRKLAISGAKLQGGSDGCDVLEAFERSHLVLSGNSTNPAQWDTRLGLQKSPFVAGLSSLSVDGGPVVLMDIVLDRVYPLAYMNGERGSREPPWNEAEEAEKTDLWKQKYEREVSRLSEEMRKNLERVQDLASQLAAHAEDISTRVSDTPPDSVESHFDDLLEAKDVSMRLHRLSGSHIVHLAHYARQRVEQVASEERYELEAQLKEACPRRDIRDFRIVRFSDARAGTRDKVRTGMLQVWDARSLGAELAEGRRFLVSSLIPGRNGDWSKPKPGAIAEVYLHTRRESRWKAVAVV